MSELFCKEYLTDLSLIPLTFTYANVRYKGLKEGFEGIKVSSRAYCDRVEHLLSARHTASGAEFRVFLPIGSRETAFP